MGFHAHGRAAGAWGIGQKVPLTPALSRKWGEGSKVGSDLTSQPLALLGALQAHAPSEPAPLATLFPATGIHALLGVPGVSSSAGFAAARGLARQGSLIC